MKFFSKELSDKLQEIGCVSESKFYYEDVSIEMSSSIRGPFYYSEEPEQPISYTEIIPTFTIADFLNNEPYALENCKKIWGNKIRLEGSSNEIFYNLEGPAYLLFRHALLDATDQEALLWEALGGKGEV